MYSRFLMIFWGMIPDTLDEPFPGKLVDSITWPVHFIFIYLNLFVYLNALEAFIVYVISTDSISRSYKRINKLVLPSPKILKVR